MTQSGATIARLQRRLRVAAGQEPGDLVLAGGRVVNVFTGTIADANVVIADGAIAGVGPYDWSATRRFELRGKFILPGLIDAHMHLESTLLVPGELARVLVPHGTTAVICDPHEIGNVLGVRGIEALIAATADLPLDYYFMAPSCVPASRWEDSGAELGPPEVARLLGFPRVLGLAEVMDFPGVLAGAPDVLAKLAAAARSVVDGHAPGLRARELLAYAAAGIRSDHESTTLDEAREKAALGLLVQVREGSGARNLDALLPGMCDGSLGDWCLCTDDVHPADLLERGHIDGLVRRLIAGGIPPTAAVRHATLVPARHYGLRDRGAVAPGFRADLVVVGDLESFVPDLVLKDGQSVAQALQPLFPSSVRSVDDSNSVRLPPLDESAFALMPGAAVCPIIRAFPDQIVTVREVAAVARDRGRWVFDPDCDVAMIANIERHRRTGRIGLGLVAGFGFRRHGALGTSVAHDAHNLLVVGTNAADMLTCARALAAHGGGFAVVANGALAAVLELPIAGLLSPLPAPQVASRLGEVHSAAAGLGCTLPAPFATLSFLALSVIGEIRITTRGVLDVARQELIPL